MWKNIAIILLLVITFFAGAIYGSDDEPEQAEFEIQRTFEADC